MRQKVGLEADVEVVGPHWCAKNEANQTIAHALSFRVILLWQITNFGLTFVLKTNTSTGVPMFKNTIFVSRL